MTRDLLLEIGTEEIPAGYLPPAAAELRDRLAKGLQERRIGSTSAETFASPRHLIAIVRGLDERQADLDREVLGPPAKVAFGADGTLSKAGEGFARSQGVPVASLRRLETTKGEYVAATVHETGRPTADVLTAWLPELIAGLPFPKTMKWDGDLVRFARPIRWLVALLGEEVLPLQVGAVKAGRLTRGHRLFTTGPVEVRNADSILATLENAGVIADPMERAARIRSGVESAAAKAGGRVVSDPGLLEEVTYLVEFPGAVLGSFDPEFLEIPREIVTTAMRSHQRYFAVEDAAGKLLPHFITVANGRWDDPSQVIAGNERVLRARLADARFYWDTDLRKGMEAHRQELKTVVWLEGAGTLFDRTERIENLVGWLGVELRSADGRPVADEGAVTAARRAAGLAKADLATEMIKDGKEFTSLQGIVGSEYARASGEPAEVVRAIREHYQPRGPSDPLPGSIAGLLVSMADRLDLVVGCFAMGLKPSGSQDPYALRRAANGLVRILLENEWHLNLSGAVRAAFDGLPETARKREGEVPAEVVAFLRDRIEFFLREADVPYDVVQAVLGATGDDPVDLKARAAALAAIRGEPDLERLVIGYKRATNILKGIDTEFPPPDDVMMAGALPVEHDLHGAAKAAGHALDEATARVDYPSAVAAFLTLRAPIDAFFEGVMVMSTDPAEKNRRLALLAETRRLFDRLYDLSKIVVEG